MSDTQLDRARALVDELGMSGDTGEVDAHTVLDALAVAGLKLSRITIDNPASAELFTAYDAEVGNA